MQSPHGPQECRSHDNQKCPFGTRASPGPTHTSASPDLVPVDCTSRSDAPSASTSAFPVSSASGASAEPLGVLTSSDGPARWVKCAVGNCYTVFYSNATAPRCMLCSDGTVPCVIENCSRRMDEKTGAVCTTCLKWKCTECIRAFNASEITADRIVHKLRERDVQHLYCQRHLPAADRTRRGLKPKPRQPITRVLTKLKRLRLYKKTKKPSGKGLSRQRRPACIVITNGVQCHERGRPEPPYNGKCSKHTHEEHYGRTGLHAALVSIDDIRDPMVPRHGLNKHSGTSPPLGMQARFAHTCSFCGAQHFSEERVYHNKAWSPGLCCLHGKLTNIERVPRAPYPVFVDRHMTALGTNAEFRRDIRRYNAAVSFVSFADTGGNVARHLPGRGPYTYAIQGQVYHSMSSLDPPNDQSRAYGQLYFYAPDEALERRLSIFDGLRRDFLESLQSILYYDVRNSALQQLSPSHPPSCFNPYVTAFHHMFSVWQNSRPDHRLVRFQFQTGITPDPRRYNTPSAAEVAAIYDGEAPPTTRGICVYPTPTASGGSTYTPSFLSDHLDPLAYPLLFPDGQRGWHSKLPYFSARSACSAPGSGTGGRQHISQAEFYSHRLMTRDPLPPRGLRR